MRQVLPTTTAAPSSKPPLLRAKCAPASAVLGMLIACATPPTLAIPTITDLGVLPGGNPLFTRACATAISADGRVVVGYSSSAAGQRAFRWTATDGMLSLGALSNINLISTAEALSADGSIIVGTCIGSSGRSRAFRWTAAGGMQDLGTFEDSLGSMAKSISADGTTVVGSASATASRHAIAIRWTAARGMESIDSSIISAMAISPSGSVIAGNGGADYSYRAIRWSLPTGSQDLGILPGADSAEVHALSADGSVVVGHSGDQLNETFYIAYRWTLEEGMLELGHLPGAPISSANACTADGSIIVGRSDRDPDSRAFIWTRSHGMIDLGLLLYLNGVDVSDWLLLSATGISADGSSVVGFGEFRGEVHPFLIRGLFVCPADFNSDGAIDFFDYLDFVEALSITAPSADFNRDGIVDVFDYLDFVAAFSMGC